MEEEGKILLIKKNPITVILKFLLVFKITRIHKIQLYSCITKGYANH